MSTTRYGRQASQIKSRISGGNDGNQVKVRFVVDCISSFLEDREWVREMLCRVTNISAELSWGQHLAAVPQKQVSKATLDLSY